MFGRETRMLLRHSLEQGTSKSALARQLGVSRDTIHRRIPEGDLDRDLDDEVVRDGPWPSATKSSSRTNRSLRAAVGFPALSAVRLLDEISAAGYTGGYSQLTGFVQRVRPTRAPEPVIRFEAPAGRQTPVDLRALSVYVGRPLCVAGRARLLRVALVSVLSASGHGDVDRRSRGCLPGLRRRAAGVALR
jgi:transposase